MAWAVRSGVTRTARLFLVEENQSALTKTGRALARNGAQMTVDAVGEAVLTEVEAERYAHAMRRIIDWQQSSGARPHVSVKLSGLTPRFDPIDPSGSVSRVLERIAPLMQRVLATNAALTVDMEHHELKPLVLDAFKALVERYAEGTWQPGIALQAYLRETEEDLARLVRWVRSHGRPVSVRLVKGAYWDTEVALAAQREWPAPVYLDKSETDANYERLTRTLFANADLVFPAIAGHNLRSLAHAIAAADAAGLPRDRWEIQMLYGMAEPLQAALAQRGVPLRIYVPTGELVTGIAYLIRRLLENTASSSVLRQTYAEGQDTAVLLAAPAPRATAAVRNTPKPTFRSTPVLDFSRRETRDAFAAALASVASKAGARYPLAIAGATTTELYQARNPARPDSILGHVELTDGAGARQAIANAREAWRTWRATPASERIAMMRRASALILERRMELAAWQVLEQAKNWREADADVAEAIDYLDYYATGMERLQGWRTTIDYPGETNATRFEPRGTAVIISPWNFPLAILAGMTSAALVTGNCAIMKPAMPAQIVAHLFHRILLEAGFPPGVCQLVPGHGSAVGDVLVDDPHVHVIAFTGSREIGQRILERSARFSPEQQHVKRVVCEMGGKNAIVVDDDADLDEVVRETLHSAFGYQGQKCSACSRLIAVGGIHDRLLARLASALEAWPYGPPDDPQYVFGPLITEAAQAKTLEYIEIGKTRRAARLSGPRAGDGLLRRTRDFRGHPSASSARAGRDLRSGARGHAGGVVRSGDRDGAGFTLCADRRRVLPFARASRACARAVSGRQRVSQPAHHRRACGRATVWRLPPLRHRHPGGRRGVSKAVHVVARRDREHDPPRRTSLEPFCSRPRPFDGNANCAGMLRSREPADGGAVPAAKREVRPGSGLRRALRTACLCAPPPSDPRKRARRRAEEGPLWGSDPGDAQGRHRSTRQRSAPRSHPASGSLLHVAPIPPFRLQRTRCSAAPLTTTGRF